MLFCGILLLPAMGIIITSVFNINKLLEYEYRDLKLFELFIMAIIVIFINFLYYKINEKEGLIDKEKQIAIKAKEEYENKTRELQYEKNKYELKFNECKNITEKITNIIKEDYPYELRTKRYEHFGVLDQFMTSWNFYKKEYEKKIKALDYEYGKKDEYLKSLLNSSFPFNKVSSLSADAETLIFKEAQKYLVSKSHPAYSASETIREMRKESIYHIEAYKTMLYKYEFLLKSFPELEKYVDDYESLKNISNCTSYSEFEENIDRVSDYVTKEEWTQMSIDKRNQLALDRYKEKEKSSWVIGMEYEMYIDFLLRKNGFKTIPYGIKKGLEDLGRDIIAYKGDCAYIIQCKNWSKKKEIHENVICQLFGTSIEYQISKNNNLLPGFKEKVVPVLYSTTKLSDMAMKFAKKLGVEVIVAEKKDYPMIKCNIGNNGEKIYHLPFDQQYYKTVIDKEGEFYAWTIEEAVNAGFRRAFKYTGYK